MNMIVHKDKSGQPNLTFPELLREQSDIDRSIVVRVEDGLPVITPLGNVVHPAWDYDAGRRVITCYVSRLEAVFQKIVKC